MTVRLVVLVSGRGSNLRAIAEAIDAGRCDATIVAVVSDKPEAAALDFARERGVTAIAVPFQKGDDRSLWNVALVQAVAAHTPDYVVLAGFMRILGTAFIDEFASRIVNVHPSLLPAFPGHDGPAQAIRAGVRITGCTVHLVDFGVDTGTILAQAAVPVLPSDDVASLHARIQRVEHALLPAVIHALATRDISAANHEPVELRCTIEERPALIVPSFDILLP
jgi:phosphoribosylglycinamide formyltransferase-1